jgi:uncharacterized membrane protein
MYFLASLYLLFRKRMPKKTAVSEKTAETSQLSKESNIEKVLSVLILLKFRMFEKSRVSIKY